MYSEELTMASGRSREGVSDLAMPPRGLRAGQSGDVFEDALTEAADGLDTGYERGKFR